MDKLGWIEERMSEIGETLAPFCHADQPYALLDWPNYSNVGDSAIWLGNIICFRQKFRRMPSYASAAGTTPDRLDYHCPEGVVFLNGGGNFGDLWTGINDRRVALLQSHRHRRIVQLPQSIHFSSQSELARMQRAIEAHPDFTLIVRDVASRDFARQHFACETLLCPDMALMLGPLKPPAAPGEDVFCLMRSDKERAVQIEIDKPGLTADWIAGEPPLMTRSDRFLQRLYFKALRHDTPPLMVRPLISRRIAMMNRHAELRLQRGLRLLAQGRQVLTDRLHGHILCTLMGIPHVVLDNSYAKLGNFITTWPPDGHTTVAADMTEARALLSGPQSTPKSL